MAELALAQSELRQLKEARWQGRFRDVDVQPSEPKCAGYFEVDLRALLTVGSNVGEPSLSPA
eukprot:14801443-Alexandrium_andersonii.AAC.1